MAQFYEVIVFSDQTSMYVDPIIERLDKNRFLAGRLAREANQYVEGEYLRDLTKLNRDVGTVLYITARPSTSIQQENVVQISPYVVDSEGRTAGGVDTTLLDLMPFLESIVRLNVKDVREVLASYKQEQEGTGKSIPEIFRSRQFRFQKQQRQKSAGVKPAFSRGW
jgi:import inner membrane translocase subunit TIM50